MHASLGCLIYYIKFRPFRTDYLNRIELFNEATYLTCVYLSIMCTDIVTDQSTKVAMGWVFIIVIVLNLAVNFCGIIYIVFAFVSQILRKLRLVLAYLDIINEKRKTVPLKPLN
jgi:hypothetical protein